MLGVRRTTVSLAAHALQAAGLIQYSRGQIKIINRNGLMETACECYEAVRGYIDKAIP
jgi:DNA-binding transcriptional regulator YhcF (GntR family)